MPQRETLGTREWRLAVARRAVTPSRGVSTELTGDTEEDLSFSDAPCAPRPPCETFGRFSVSEAVDLPSESKFMEYCMYGKNIH